MVEVQDYGTYYLNSTIITIVSMVIIALLSSFSGYALARFEFPGKRLAFVMNIGLLVIPMEITLVSTFTLLYKYGLLDTKLGLILPYSTFLLFFSTLVMRSAFLNLPSDLEDAGLIDGCSEFRIFWSIAFPLARNSVIFVLINAFIWIWNEFVFASVIASSPASKTLPVAIAEVQRNSGWWDFGQITSAAVLTMAPVIIIFLIFQKHFMKGLMEGAVKG
ncbi:MAG: carbohydrate ABC transporter permease [Firmicutes bacterium]|nr:carbohydrate ABC transporter permease [Bacillota bacterium]